MYRKDGNEKMPEYAVPELVMYDVEAEKGYGASDGILPMEEDPWEDL